MPRKKKPTEGLDSRGQDGEEEEEEKRNPANAKKKRSFVDAFIVISDSDGEVSDGLLVSRDCAGPCCCRRVPEHPMLCVLGSGFAQRVLCCSFSYMWDESNPIWLGNEWCASWGWVMSLGFDNQILSELNLKRNLKVTFPQSLYKSFFHNFYLIDFQLNHRNMILYYVQIDKKMIQNTGLWVAQTQLVSGKLILNYGSLNF